jgi:hypothetical protein
MTSRQKMPISTMNLALLTLRVYGLTLTFPTVKPKQKQLPFLVLQVMKQESLILMQLIQYPLSFD